MGQHTDGGIPIGASSQTMKSQSWSRGSQNMSIVGTDDNSLDLHVRDDLDQLTDFRRAVQRMHERIRAARMDVIHLRGHVAATVDPLLLQLKDRKRRASPARSPDPQRPKLAGTNLN